MLTARDMVKSLEKAGFVQCHQDGSHLYFKKITIQRRVSVPIHPGDLGRGLMKKIIKQAGFTEEEFSKFL